MRRRAFICRCRDDALAAFAHIRGYNWEKTLNIVIEEFKPRRSESQNALHWRWMDLAGEHTGYTKDEMHEFMKGKFCPAVEITIGDETRWIRSTKKLDRQQMSEFMDREYAFLVGELGIALPLPEQREAA